MITKKERGLIKGSIRRVFSRSELRKSVIDRSRRNYTDANRPRVKKWSACLDCDKFIPTYQMEVDHVDPIVPITMSLESMTWDEIVNRIWCDPKNLRAICRDCHKQKTKLETKKRALNRKALKVLGELLPKKRRTSKR